MRRVRIGFTIVEVSIFLAVTGLLFIGITVGVQNSIFQQRYNDAVQVFADFLRNTYSEVLNVQSASTGQSEYAIYGKMIVFGSNNNEQTIRSYSVIGEINGSNCSEDNGVKDELDCRGISVFEPGSSDKVAGIIEEYKPRWATKIQSAGDENNPQDYSGAVLIVRSPETGKVFTFKNENFGSITESAEPLNLENFDIITKDNNIDFCVNPNGDEPSNIRADVRIKEGASNASGVEVIMDSIDNNCRKHDES